MIVRQDMVPCLGSLQEAGFRSHELVTSHALQPSPRNYDRIKDA